METRFCHKSATFLKGQSIDTTMWPNSRNTNPCPSQRWYLRNSVNFRYRRQMSTLSFSKCSLRADIQLLENVCLSKLRQDFYSLPAALESGPRAQGWRWHRRWCSSPINRKPGRRGAGAAMRCPREPHTPLTHSQLWSQCSSLMFPLFNLTCPLLYR